jgi:ABC-type transport system involved in multi-copper enzyme maturation permease subunit
MMGFAENPVMQRELLVNLRTPRAFILLALYQLLLAGVVVLAWPREERLDLSRDPVSARKLIDLFFLGQYVITSLMAPSFAAGSITGEKERKTYELLLASPLRPGAIVFGKMIASLTHLGLLVVASLPIIVVCLPLGGVSLYEVLAAYMGLIVSVIVFGAIGVACSSYFGRTAAALMVSYLTILPMVLGGIMFWILLQNDGQLRLQIFTTILPAFGLTISIMLCSAAAARMIYPPDVGSEGNEVVDIERESVNAVGLVIHRDQFPDRLFAPPKRKSLMKDNANPIFDKEIHSELFSQGTLMLRLVIQISMFLAIPLMAWLLFWLPDHSPWYISYVLVFNMLVGPVFNAGSVTSERERQTLDLLLTTIISPWQILWGKWIAGLRVSSVLTSFLLWPLILAAVLHSSYWSNLLAVLAFLLIILFSCVSNSLIALFCSVIFRKTSLSLMGTYTILLVVYACPLALTALLSILEFPASTIETVRWLGIASPFTAAFAVPLNAEMTIEATNAARAGNLGLLLGHFAFTTLLIAILMGSMLKLFQWRWRVSEG